MSEKLYELKWSDAYKEDPINYDEGGTPMPEVKAWEPGIPDKLLCRCPYCGRNPEVDYVVYDDVWRQTVPKEYRPGVICLICFLRLANNKPYLFNCIQRIFVATDDYTLGLNITEIYDIRELSCPK